MSPTYDDVRAAIMRIRDAHKMGPDAFCNAINREPIDPPDGRGWYVGPWTLTAVERSEGGHARSGHVVARTLRARELGRLARASADDVLTLERWLAAHESA